MLGAWAGGVGAWAWYERICLSSTDVRACARVRTGMLVLGLALLGQNLGPFVPNVETVWAATAGTAANDNALAVAASPTHTFV